MGEMIKFGIKMALTIATAAALMAAVLILFNLISSVTVTSTGFVTDIFQIISLVFPINIYLIFTCITSLFAFKIAYWAADKMLWLIDVLG